MIISHRHRFIFIHLHKCAGTSVTRGLLPVLGDGDLAFGCTPELEDRSQASRANGGLHKHSRASEIRARVGEDVWRRYLKFTVVRNPWDLVLSKYYWWHKTPADWDERAAMRKGAIMNLTFREFVLGLGPAHAYCDWLISDTESSAPRVDMDFVARFENLAQDLATVAGRIGLPGIELPVENTSRELRRHPSYVEHYDEASAARVEQIYHREIALFGYRFGA